MYDCVCESGLGPAGPRPAPRRSGPVQLVSRPRPVRSQSRVRAAAARGPPAPIGCSADVKYVISLVFLVSRRARSPSGLATHATKRSARSHTPHTHATVAPPAGAADKGTSQERLHSARREAPATQTHGADTVRPISARTAHIHARPHLVVPASTHPRDHPRTQSPNIPSRFTSSLSFSPAPPDPGMIPAVTIPGSLHSCLKGGGDA